MTEEETNMPIATIDLTIESALSHPGTSLFAEVAIKNTGKSVLQITTEPYTYANRFQVAKRGEEEDAVVVSAKDALLSRMTDDLPPRRKDPISLQPNGEITDREDIASYFQESLKPGTWSIRATRELASKETLRSEWKYVTVSPWQFSLAALRFDADGSHWQSSILNKEENGEFKLWVNYSDGKHPASGTFQNWTAPLGANAPIAPAPEKITSISFAQLYSSASDEWMLVKEGRSLRALRSSGVVTEACHGNLKSDEPIELLETGIFLDKGERSLFAAINANSTGGTRIHFFKAGDGKVVPAGSADIEPMLPDQIAHCWAQRGNKVRLFLAYATRALGGKPAIDFWTQELEWASETQAVHVESAARQWTGAREAIAIQWDPAHTSHETIPSLAILVPTKDPRSLELIQIKTGQAPQSRPIVLRSGMKPEKAALFTRADGQWALVVLSGNGILSQQPGSDTWSLLSQEKTPVRLLRAARAVGDDQWAAWIVEGRGLKWAKIGKGR